MFLTGHPSSAAYVAEAGDDLLGVIAVHVCPFFERDGSWGRIVALVVSDRARRRGYIDLAGTSSRFLRDLTP